MTHSSDHTELIHLWATCKWEQATDNRPEAREHSPGYTRGSASRSTASGLAQGRIRGTEIPAHTGVRMACRGLRKSNKSPPATSAAMPNEGAAFTQAPFAPREAIAPTRLVLRDGTPLFKPASSHRHCHRWPWSPICLYFTRVMRHQGQAPPEAEQKLGNPTSCRPPLSAERLTASTGGSTGAGAGSFSGAGGVLLKERPGVGSASSEQSC